ncbi:MAG TPA: hypothetical protein ENN22_00225 [bacterium]|nr:hypothetical protein [bacterium]
MKKIAIIFTLLVLLPAMAIGQLKTQEKQLQIREELRRPAADQFLGLSIFDPSKLTMSHSVSMSYFSMGGESFSQSMYLNKLQYQLSSPLLLTVQWGVQNFPHNTFSQDHPAFNSGFFLSGAEIKYQPSDKFEMRFQYQTMPGLYNRSMYYNDPFRFQSRRSWWDIDQ